MGDDDEYSDTEEEFWEQLAAREPGIDHANARWSLWKAKQGDWRDLEKRVRSDTKLNSKERAFIADIIAGSIKRPNHDHPDFEAHNRCWEIACYVVWGETQQLSVGKKPRKKPVIGAAVQVFGVSPSGVYAALDRYREEAKKYRDSLLQYGLVSELIPIFYWKPGARLPTRNYPGPRKRKPVDRTSKRRLRAI
jgi:hypothetical protein